MLQYNTLDQNQDQRANYDRNLTTLQSHYQDKLALGVVIHQQTESLRPWAVAAFGRPIQRGNLNPEEQLIIEANETLPVPFSDYAIPPIVTTNTRRREMFFRQFALAVEYGYKELMAGSVDQTNVHIAMKFQIVQNAIFSLMNIMAHMRIQAETLFRVRVDIPNGARDYAAAATFQNKMFAIMSLNPLGFQSLVTTIQELRSQLPNTKQATLFVLPLGALTLNSYGNDYAQEAARAGETSARALQNAIMTKPATIAGARVYTDGVYHMATSEANREVHEPMIGDITYGLFYTVPASPYSGSFDKFNARQHHSLHATDFGTDCVHSIPLPALLDACPSFNADGSLRVAAFEQTMHDAARTMSENSMHLQVENGMQLIDPHIAYAGSTQSPYVINMLGEMMDAYFSSATLCTVADSIVAAAKRIIPDTKSFAVLEAAISASYNVTLADLTACSNVFYPNNVPAVDAGGRVALAETNAWGVRDVPGADEAARTASLVTAKAVLDANGKITQMPAGCVSFSWFMYFHETGRLAPELDTAFMVALDFVRYLKSVFDQPQRASNGLHVLFSRTALPLWQTPTDVAGAATSDEKLGLIAAMQNMLGSTRFPVLRARPRTRPADLNVDAVKRAILNGVPEGDLAGGAAGRAQRFFGQFTGALGAVIGVPALSDLNRLATETEEHFSEQYVVPFLRRWAQNTSVFTNQIPDNASSEEAFAQFLANVVFPDVAGAATEEQIIQTAHHLNALLEELRVGTGNTFGSADWARVRRAAQDALAEARARGVAMTPLQTGTTAGTRIMTQLTVNPAILRGQTDFNAFGMVDVRTGARSQVEYAERAFGGAGIDEVGGRSNVFTQSSAWHMGESEMASSSSAAMVEEPVMHSSLHGGASFGNPVTGRGRISGENVRAASRLAGGSAAFAPVFFQRAMRNIHFNNRLERVMNEADPARRAAMLAVITMPIHREVFKAMASANMLVPYKLAVLYPNIRFRMGAVYALNENIGLIRYEMANWLDTMQQTGVIMGAFNAHIGVMVTDDNNVSVIENVIYREYCGGHSINRRSLVRYAGTFVDGSGNVATRTAKGDGLVVALGVDSTIEAPMFDMYGIPNAVSNACHLGETSNGQPVNFSSILRHPAHPSCNFLRTIAPEYLRAPEGFNFGETKSLALLKDISRIQNAARNTHVFRARQWEWNPEAGRVESGDTLCGYGPVGGNIQPGRMCSLFNGTKVMDNGLRVSVTAGGH